MEQLTFLDGVVACVCAEDPDIKAEVERLVQFYGGTCVAAYDGTTCTHVVAAATSLEDPTCQLAAADGKIVYSDLWLKSCIQEGRLLPLRDALHRPPVSSVGIPGAEGMVLCLTGFTGETRKELQFMAELIGAEFSKPLKVFHVTHLICYDLTGDKYEVAKARGIHIVNRYWLQDCYLSWTLRPEAEYARSTKAMEEEERAHQSVHQGGLPFPGNAEGSGRAPAGGPTGLASESFQASGAHKGARAEVLGRPGPDSNGSGRPGEAGGPGCAVSADPFPTLPATCGGIDRVVCPEGDQEQAVISLKQAAAAQATGRAAPSGVLAEVNKNCPARNPPSGAVKAADARAKVGDGARGGSPAARPCDANVPEAGQEGGAGRRSTAAVGALGAESAGVEQADARGRESLGGTGNGAVRADEYEAPLSTFETARENLPSQPSQCTSDAGVPCADPGARPRLLSPVAASADAVRIKASCNPLLPAVDAGEGEAVEAERVGNGGGGEKEADSASVMEAPGLQGPERPSGGAPAPSASSGEACKASAEMESVTLGDAVTEGNGDPVVGEATDLPTSPLACAKESALKGKQKRTKKGSQAAARGSKRSNAGQRGRAQDVAEPSAPGGPFEYLGTQEQMRNQDEMAPEKSLVQDAQQPKRRKGSPHVTTPPLASSALELGSPACALELGSPAPSPPPWPTTVAQDSAKPQAAGPSANAARPTKGRRGRPRKIQQPEKNAAAEAGPASDPSPAKAPGVSPQKPLPGRTSAPSRGRGRPAAESADATKEKKAVHGSEEEGVRRFTFGGLSGDREKDALKKLAVRLGAKVCGGSQAVDERQWDKRVTHLLLGSPLKRTEKLLGATAAGRWVLRPAYLKDSAARGTFLAEAEYEWSGVGMNEDGTFDLAAPKHWREVRDKTGMRAFERLHVGLLHSLGPHLGVLERTITGAGGTVHLIGPNSKAPSPALARKIHFLVMPSDEPALNQQVGMQWKALGVACVAPQYFVDYIAKPWSALDAHVLLDTHEAASAALCALRERLAQGMAEAESDIRISSTEQGNVRMCEESLSEGESQDLGGSGGDH